MVGGVANQQETVRIIEPFSVWYSVTSSVPQVTVFPPQLLIIYIDEWIKDQMDFSQFVVDVWIGGYESCKEDMEVLKWDVDRLSDFVRSCQ